MSDYLVQRILSAKDISLRVKTEIIDMNGDDQLRNVTWRCEQLGSLETREISNVFVMIGARPKTAWLGRDLAVDSKGFILTGLVQQTSSVRIKLASTPWETFDQALSNVSPQRLAKDLSSYRKFTSTWRRNQPRLPTKTPALPSYI
jgi:hypothetical protein